MMPRRRWSLLGVACLCLWTPAEAQFKDAAVARHGREQIEFLREFLAGRPVGAKADSIQSLVSSLLTAQSDDSRPPMDFSALDRNAELRVSLLLDHAEAMYQAERYPQASAALQVLGSPGGAEAGRAEALRLRLALRGSGKAEVKAGASEGAVLLNQALVRLADGDRAGAMKLLQGVADDKRQAPAIRQRGALWFALLAGQTASPREVLNALDDLNGNSALLAEGWLAALRLFADVHPAAASAIEQALVKRIPESSARWEARDYLVRTLQARGATTQAAELSLDAVTALGRMLVRIEQLQQGLAQLPEAEFRALVGVLPEGAKARATTLQRRKQDMTQAAELLRRWRPYLDAYRGRLQRDPAALATDIRNAVTAVKEASRRDAGKSGGLGDLFRIELTQLLGAPPSRDIAYRLFFGFTQWETDYEYPETWRPAFERPSEDATGKRRRAREAAQRRQQLDRDLLPQAIDHLSLLQRKVEARVGKVPTSTFRGMADRAAELGKKNAAAVQEIERVLPGIDRAIQEEVAQALRERHRMLERWLGRFAAHAVAIHAAHKSGSEQPFFPLGRELRTGDSTSLVASLRGFDDEPKSRKAGDIDVKPVWQLLRQIATGSDDRQVRADALRLRAQLSVSLYEAQAIPSVDDAVEHYQILLRDYGDLIDRAEVTYQLARALDLAQKMTASQAVLAEFAERYPGDPRAGEALFRVGETHFSLGAYPEAQQAYAAAIARGDSRHRDQAEYKLAWSLFKMGEYRDALPRFMAVIDRSAGDRSGADRQKQERLRDTFRAVALTFAYLNGAADVERYFADAGARPYVDDIYYSLARYYLEHDRINDAAVTYDHLARYFPQDARLPVLLADLIVGARREKLNKLALDLVERFIDTYALDGAYWKAAGEPVRGEIRQRIQPYLADIGQMYHADAQQNRNADSYARAIRYYRQYIATFPQDPQSARFQFLLAEAHFESSDYRTALAEYERAAYQFGKHGDAATAGYAGLVTNQKLADAETDPDQRKRLLRELVSRSGRFADAFPTESRANAVLAKAAEDMLMLGEPGEAVAIAERLLTRRPDDLIRRRAWIVIAHGRFESQSFAAAESAYLEALTQKGGAIEETAALRGRLALSIYRQAESLRASGDRTQAIANFLRVGKTVPEAEPVPNAEIDAAVLLMETRQWASAIQVLENFQKAHAAHPLNAGVPTRLAYAYENDGRLLKAADLLESLSLAEKDDALARQMAWRAGELRDKGERPDLAAASFERYLTRYPAPLEKATEVRQLLADLASRKGDAATRDRWLDQLVAQARGVADATPRVRFLAAQAALGFGDARKSEFEAVALRLPLDKSLAAKRAALEGALRWYEEAGRFGVIEQSSVATHQIAELYARLAADIIASERPTGLNELEAGQYKLLLEEEAFPFEEKATEFHAINHQRIRTGYYDEWVARSLRALARLVPARYDRVESAGGYFDYVPPAPVRSDGAKTAAAGEPEKPDGAAVKPQGAGNAVPAR